MLPSVWTSTPVFRPSGGVPEGSRCRYPEEMSTPPTTRPETWVPAGAEREGTPGGSPAEGPASRKRASVTLPPKESLQASKPSGGGKSGLRRQVAGLKWAVLGIALPWTWFLIRDLGPAMQLVALALPLLVAASILGVLISAIDEKKVTSVLVAMSIGIFGWVTVMGPRGAEPARAPQDPVRVADIAIPAEGPKAQSVLDALQKAHADVAVLAVPAKKDRAALLDAETFDASATSGAFIVLSAYPVKVLPLPKSLPKALVIRVEVDRPDGAFVLYGARVDDALQAALQAPLDIEHLQAAALDEDLPVVIAGGLGVSDRSTGYRQLDATFRDALRSGSHAQNTLLGLLWMPVMLRSDYVFTSHAWCAADGTSFPVTGIDHAAVAASVGACPKS